jgi:hypothetical protein
MKRFATISNLRLAFEILLVVALLLIALPNSVNTQASAQQEQLAPTAIYWYQCNPPTHVAVFTNRVHIWCSSTTPVAGAPAIPAISWFAFPTSPDSAGASRFLSILQSTRLIDGYVWLELDPNDTSGTAFGCAEANCRRIVGAELR